MEKTLRAVIGVFIVSAVCSPLAQLKKADDILPAYAFNDTGSVSTQSLEEQMLEACKSTVGAVVESAAEEMGIEDYRVKTNAYVDESLCIIIQDIQVDIPSENAGSQNSFSAVLQERLGVPVTVECS